MSSNFGNVLSVTVASLFLPFLPMSALQLVLLSLVYEIVCIALPWDTVDNAWTAARALGTLRPSRALCSSWAP